MADAIIGRVRAVITADTKGLDSGLARASARLGSFGQSATKVGRTLTTRLTLPIAGVGVAAVKMASDFEKSMASIVGLVGVAADEVKAMEGSVRSMARAFGSSATEAGNALFFITSAGLRGADATSTLEASLKAAAVGLGDVSTIADLATSALNAYGSDTLSATAATDVLTAAVREGKLEASQLAGSMGGVLPIASAMGVQFNEVGAAFAALSRTGTNAAEAATQINGILGALLKPTQQAEKALRTMGLSSEFLRANIKEKGLLDTLKLLADEFDGNAAATASVFGNVRALKGVMDLMGANVAGTEAIFASMADTTGTVDQAFSVMAETTAFKFQQAVAEMKDLLLEFGQTIMPIVVRALEGVSGILASVSSAFGGMSQGTKDVIVALAGVAAIAGPVALAIGGVTKAMIALRAAAMAHPALMAFSLAIGAISAAAAMFHREAREARDRQESLTAAFVEAGDPASTVVDRLQDIAAGMEAVTAASSDAEDGVEEFMGAAVLNAELMKRDVLDEFGALSTEGQEALRNLVESGFDFEGSNLFRNFQNMNDATGALAATYNTASGPLEDFALALYEQAEAGELTVREIENILVATKDVGKAYEDHHKAVEELNEEYVTSAQVFKDFEGKLPEKAIRDIITTSDTYTEALLRIEAAANDVAYVHATDLERALKNTQEAMDSATVSANDTARMLVEAGEAAGYDKRQLVELTQQLGILDKIDPSVQVELGLDVTAFDQLIDGLDEFINAQIRLMTVFDDIPAALAARSPAVQALFDLRNALREMANAGDEVSDSFTGGGGTVDAIDELDKAAEEAAREAERLQREVDRLAEKIADLGSELVGRDFFEFMLGASADEIERRFYDIGQAAMALVEQAEALGLAGGDRFLQTLANIGVEFDRLASLQSRVASTQAEIANVEMRLADATSSLASAQADLNRENERYASFLYGEGRGGGTFGEQLDAQLAAYRELQKEVGSLEQAQKSLQDRLIASMSADAGTFAGAGGVMGNVGNVLAQARTFRNNLIELRDRGFPTDVIAQVVASGMTQGNVISRRLLALGSAEFAEFLALRDEIGRIGAETAAIAGEVIFGADIAEAQGAVQDQFAVVDAMFQSAIAQAAANVREQAAVVDRLRSALAALETRLEDLRANVETLAADIQTALRTAFDEFLAGLNAAISRLPDTPSLPSPASSGGGGGGGAGRPSAAPSAAPSASVPSAPVAAAPTPSGYSVQRGDSLWAIAARELGSGTRWREIQQANNISGTLIHPGQMLTIPGRARGGPVSGGRPYLVGEMGPELFVPGESGGIIPSSQTAAMVAGGTTYNINVTAYGDPSEAGRQIVKQIQEYERRNGSTWRS